MKNLKIALVLAAVCAASLGWGQSVMGGGSFLANKSLGEDAIVAVVEDRAITKAEVLRAVEPFIPQIRSQSTTEYEFNQRMNMYVSEIIRDLIDRELIVKEFTSKGMSIPDSYLDTYFDDYLKREFGGDRAELLRFLKNSGKTIKQFREDQKKDIIVNYMKGTMRQGVYEISPKTILEYYEKNKQKWYSAASVKLRMITLKTSMTATLEDNRKVAADIEAKIAKGADFAELAKVYSKDDSSIRGGDWGWIKKGELNPALDKEVFALKEGQTTKPIEVGDMIFIIKVEQKRPEGIQDIDDVRSQIEATIADYNSRVMYRKWIEGLRAKAYIKIYQ